MRYFSANAFIILIYLTCIYTKVYAQSGLYGIPQIKNYTSVSVNEITQTWVIKQDKKGVMYFGNSYGISVFDGVYWQIMKLSNNSVVRSMAISKNGVLFAGGMDEMGYLKPNSSGCLEYISLVDRIPVQYRNFGVVKDVFVLQNYMAFLCDSRLFLLHNDSIHVIPSIDYFEKGYVVQDKLFIYEKNSGLKELTGFGLSNVPGSEVLGQFAPVALIPWENNKLMAFSRGNGAFTFESGKFEPALKESLKLLSENKINCGIVLKNGNIILGTVLKGIIMLNPEGKVLLNLDKKQGLDNNNVLTVFEDCYDNLWVGHDNGVTLIEINSPFSYINNQFVPGAGYTSVYYKNLLYLGTSQGLFASRLSNGQNQWNVPKFQLIQGTEGMVWNLTVIDDILLMGHDNGTYIISDFKANKIGTPPGGWCFQKLINYPDYIIEGCYSGFLLYKKEGQTFHFIRRIQGFDESCRVFEQDEKGKIWIAHGYKGLFSLQLGKNLEKAEGVKFYGDKRGFPSNLGINVFKIDNDLIFSSEAGGLFNYNEKSDSFELNTSFEPYLGSRPRISKIYEQKSGDIWVNELNRTGILLKQNNGTYKYEYQSFNKLKNALIKGFEHFGNLPDNNTIFGFGDGFIHYNPFQQKDYNYPFYSLIRKVEIISQKDSLLYGGFTLNEPDSLNVLPYKFNSLRFLFAATYFEDIEVTHYSYFLEGFDKNWSEWTSKTDREYTNLPARKYVFRVKARNIYGVESNADNYSFEINPPFTRTWWAYLIYFTIGLYGLFSLFKFYSRKKENKLRRENIQKDREIIKLKNLQLNAELEYKNNELGNLTSHLVNKNAILQIVKDYLNSIYNNLGAKDQKEIISLTRKIDSEADIDKEWSLIEPHFDSVHKGFLTKLKAKYPELRPNDLRLCAYIQMNLSSKEIAVLMNNTPHGVEAQRYRLRKVFEFNREMNLKDFLNSL
jgi:hypothetical protein